MKNVLEFFSKFFFFFFASEKANVFFCSRLHLGKVLNLGLQHNEHYVFLKKKNIKTDK